MYDDANYIIHANLDTFSPHGLVKLHHTARTGTLLFYPF